MSGNVWPELVTVGTVMRPMASDMGLRSKVAEQARNYWNGSCKLQLEPAARTWCAVIGRSKIAGGKKVDVPNVEIHRQTASSLGKKLTRQSDCWLKRMFRRRWAC